MVDKILARVFSRIRFRSIATQKQYRVMLDCRFHDATFKVYPTHFAIHLLPAAHVQRHCLHMVDRTLAWIRSRICFRPSAHPKRYRFIFTAELHGVAFKAYPTHTRHSPFACSACPKALLAHGRQDSGLDSFQNLFSAVCPPETVRNSMALHSKSIPLIHGELMRQTLMASNNKEDSEKDCAVDAKWQLEHGPTPMKW
jgi:hypothetical protein